MYAKNRKKSKTPCTLIRLLSPQKCKNIPTSRNTKKTKSLTTFVFFNFSIHHSILATLRDDAWRQQRSLNERDLLSVNNSSYSNDYRLSSSNRLYSSADRDRYELHRERLEKYPLTRTARLDVQQRNTFNRTNHDRQTAASAYGPLGAASAKVRDIAHTDSLYAGGVSARRAPPLATAAQRSGGSSYLHKHPQIVIGDTSLGANSSVSLYDRYMGGSGSGVGGIGGNSTAMMTSSLSGSEGATRSLSRERSLVDSYWDESATPSSALVTNKAQDSRRFTERRIKKTVRFDAHDIDNTTGVDTLVGGLHSTSSSLPPVTTILPSTAVEVGAATILTSAKLKAHSSSSASSSATNTATNILSDTTSHRATNEWSRWEAERQGSQDSATKDSGIDTSSTFTSSEDSNRGDGPKVANNVKNFTILCV